jgi:hypothetical protein
MRPHELPRPYRLAIPVEVVPSIDKLHAAGFKNTVIARQLDVHWRTVAGVIKRRGGYKDIPK